MKIILWSISFLCLVIAAITGIGASIGALQTEWFAVCVFCIAGMFSSAEYADTINDQGNYLENNSLPACAGFVFGAIIHSSTTKETS